jgi:DNA-binding NtrC family response regulator
MASFDDEKKTLNKILIVDDDTSVTDFLALFLDKKGYKNVILSHTGGEGIKQVENDDIKLVLLDVRLPDMSGLDVLKKIKELKPDIGVIMITGYPEEDVAKEAIKKGAYDYIIKPFDLAYLELSVLTKIVLMA